MNAKQMVGCSRTLSFVFRPSGVLSQATQGQTSSTTAQSGSGAAPKASSNDHQATVPAFSTICLEFGCSIQTACTRRPRHECHR